jgi:GST-like protein
VFESTHILVYLAEKHMSALVPTDLAKRTEVMNWTWCLHGSAPYFGQLGHFHKYAKCGPIPYAVNRYVTETRRLLSLLDQQLEGHEWVVGATMTVADISWYPWIVCLDKYYAAAELVHLAEMTNVTAWMARMAARPSVKVGMQVNGFSEDGYGAATYAAR